MSDTTRLQRWGAVLLLGLLLSVAVTTIMALDAWAAERAGGFFARDGSLRWRVFGAHVRNNAFAGLAAASLLRLPHPRARFAILGLGLAGAGLLMAELRTDPAAWERWVGDGGVLAAAVPLVALWLYAVAALTLLGWVGSAFLGRRGERPDAG